jgi:siroheme synthase-like protein
MIESGAGKRILPYYPVFLDVRGRRCVVIGGGRVALRKVISLLECGAEVRVISPSLCRELARLNADRIISAMEREYQPADLAGSFVAIAATTEADINLRIAQEARRQKVLINVVDCPEHSDFIVPSSFSRADLTIAVSTAGKSPALARKIRTKLEKEFGEEYASLVELIGEVRSELKEQSIAISADAWQDALDLEQLVDLVRNRQHDKARSMLLDNLKRA